MLARDRRLRMGRDWDTLFREGFGVSGPLVSLRARLTPGARRVGVSVGKKVGGAVVRNSVKRRLRAIARMHWDSLPEADLAFLARPGAGASGYDQLEAAALELAARAARRAP